MFSPSTLSTTQTVHSFAVGQRVVRGLDWSFGEQDGGPGCVGVIDRVDSAGVTVQWPGTPGGRSYPVVTGRELAHANPSHKSAIAAGVAAEANAMREAGIAEAKIETTYAGSGGGKSRIISGSAQTGKKATITKSISTAKCSKVKGQKVTSHSSSLIQSPSELPLDGTSGALFSSLSPAPLVPFTVVASPGASIVVESSRAEEMVPSSNEFNSTPLPNNEDQLQLMRTELPPPQITHTVVPQHTTVARAARRILNERIAAAKGGIAFLHAGGDADDAYSKVK